MQKIQFMVESAGTAENFEFGYEATHIKVTNLTQYATDTKIVASEFWRGQTDDYSYNTLGAVAAINKSISTSSGFKRVAYDQDNITGAPTTINDVTDASPAVATTTAAHGYTTGDKVRIRSVVGDMGTTLLNDNVYVITVLTSTTFSLQAPRGGANIDTTGLVYTSGGQAYNITEAVDNTNKIKYTFGTNVMGANSDILMIEAEVCDVWDNLGDAADF